MGATQRDEMQRYLDEMLDSARFRDYCPNGLQVEGRTGIARLVTGVTASQALIDAAIAHGADAILVHHGYFWRGEDARITGIRRRRLAALLGAEINLFAYHLPLDAHPELGNNAQLGRLCGWSASGRFGEQDLGWLGELPTETRLADFAASLGRALARPAQVIGDGGRCLRRIAWCSGGAQGYFEAAIERGADVFVSGEISEATVHLARESGVAYVAAGHHATERYGVQALGRHLADRFDISVEFVDIDNPV